jgi:MFS transporter, SP family, general alpha glucoside:H+ symporter
MAFPSGNTDNPPVDNMHDVELSSLEQSPTSTVVGVKTHALRRTFLLYRAAVGWSIAFSSMMIIEYYTNAMATMYFAFPQFVGDNGEYNEAAGQKEVNWLWMFLFGFLNIIGCIVGSIFNGWFSEAYGQKRAAILGLLFLDGCIFLGFFKYDIKTFCAANALIGVSFGIFSTLGITYAADVCPPRIRSYLLAYANITHICGQLLATLVLFAFRGTISGSMAYRIPWALTWVLGVGLLVVCWAPESPTWLVRRNRLEKARETLVRLMRHETPVEINARLIVIMEKNDEEKKIAKKVSFRDCFKGKNLRYTLLTCLVALTNWASGNAMIGHAVFFLRTTGIGETYIYMIPLAQCLIGILSTMASWFLIDRADRRTILLRGMIACTVILLAIGIAGLTIDNPRPTPDPLLMEGRPVPATNTPKAAYVIAGLVLVFSAVRNLTVGPIAQILYTEIPTTRLRQKTTALSRNTGFLTGLINTIALPTMLSATKWNLSAKTALIFAGLSIICTTACWIYLDETKVKEREEAQKLAKEVAEL